MTLPSDGETAARLHYQSELSRYQEDHLRLKRVHEQQRSRDQEEIERCQRDLGAAQARTLRVCFCPCIYQNPSWSFLDLWGAMHVRSRRFWGTYVASVLLFVYV